MSAEDFIRRARSDQDYPDMPEDLHVELSKIVEYNNTRAGKNSVVRLKDFLGWLNEKGWGGTRGQLQRYVSDRFKKQWSRW